jgi:hypothetical protein
VREVDAGGGWGALAARLAERINAAARGSWLPPFHYRSREGWATLLAEAGLEPQACSLDRGTPFSNVLLVCRKAGHRRRVRIGACPGSPATA